MIDMEITLEPGPWSEEGYRDCRPIAGRVQGSIRATAGAELRARRVYAELEWHTEGRGDRNRKPVGSIDLHTGSVPAGTHEWRFDFTVPEEGPISYHGHLLQILWAVRVTVDVPWGRDHHQEYAITVLPDYDSA